MTPRRKFLIGISAAAVSAPAIVRVGSLMPVRRIVMPLQENYYGFCDRLWVNCRYKSGELRGLALMRMIEERILQVPAATLAYDLQDGAQANYRWPLANSEEKLSVSVALFGHKHDRIYDTNRYGPN